MPVKKALAIAALVDSNTIAGNDPEFRCKTPGEDSYTEHAVIQALRKLGHTVSIVGVENSIEPVVKLLSENRPDLVFNLTESFRAQRRYDQNLAGLLELMGIPFTGTRSTGLMLCRDKGLCKQLLSNRKIRVPSFITVSPGEKVKVLRSVRFPMVAKPVYEDGSDGISNASLVRDERELSERVAMIHERFRQPAIAEEYIEGRELYVGVIGNGRLRVLPIRELHFGKADEGAPVLATYKVKWDTQYQQKWQISFGFGELEPRISYKVGEVCKKVFRLLQLDDYGRIDIRLTRDNQIVVLEVNPNPGLGPDDEVAQAAGRAGMKFCELIDRIVWLAVKRYDTQG